MKPISRTEAVDYANLILAADDATSPERTLARYVLAMEALIASFAQDAEQTPATENPKPQRVATRNKRANHTCHTCGETYADATLQEAYVIHRANQPQHALAIWDGRGFLVVTPNTMREINRPSGEITDRDSTGGNDPYSNA